MWGDIEETVFFGCLSPLYRKQGKLNQQESKLLTKKLAERFESRQLTEDGWVLLDEECLMAAQSDPSGTTWRVVMKKMLFPKNVKFSSKVQKFFVRKCLPNLLECGLQGSVVEVEDGSAMMLVEFTLTEPISDFDLSDLMILFGIAPMNALFDIEEKFGN